MTAETERLTYSTTEYRFTHMWIVWNVMKTACHKQEKRNCQEILCCNWLIWLSDSLNDMTETQHVCCVHRTNLY